MADAGRNRSLGANMKPTQNDIEWYHRKPRAAHCSKGHEYTKENTKYEFNNIDGCIMRKCRKCVNAISAKRYVTKRDFYHWTEILIGGI